MYSLAYTATAKETCHGHKLWHIYLRSHSCAVVASTKCITPRNPTTQIPGQIMVVVTIATSLQAAVHAWLLHTNVCVIELMSKHTTV